MGFRITGLDPVQFGFAGTSDAELAAVNARRVIADSNSGYPCRAMLEQAQIGEALILFHHVSHDVETPFRTAYAIFVRETATKAATYHNALPPFWEGRSQSLRAFDKEGMLRTAVIASHEEMADTIETLFADDEVAYIQAYNLAYGCFMAQVERD